MANLFIEGVTKAATLAGVSFLCLHQVPHDEPRYGTYLHKLQHQYLGISGFGVTTGVPVKRGCETHNVEGYICAQCGHVKIYGFEDISNGMNDVILSRIDAELWSTDKEWCDAFTTKHKIEKKEQKYNKIDTQDTREEIKNKD